MKRVAYMSLVFGLFTVLAGFSAMAQTSTAAPDQSSLGSYARSVRKDTTTTAKAKPKVFDNDNLPTDDKLSVVGDPAKATTAENTSAEPAEKSAAPTDNKDAAGSKPAGSPEDDEAKKQAAWKTWQDKLAGQKSTIDLASRELDVLQKEYQLRAAAMYADVGNRMRNAAQWDKEDADYKQKIADKQKAVEDAKQKLDDMQEEARKAGVPAAMRD
jgi:hypothetical protein